MLEFKIDEEHYIIVERIMSFTSTSTMVVTYKKDLGLKRINNEPWREVDEASKEWFEKYHRKHFDILEGVIA